MEITTDPHDLAVALADVLVHDRDVSETLTSLAELAAEQVSSERHLLCGIVLRRARRNTVVATSSLEAQQMDELQAGFDEGPCLEAQETGAVIRVPDVRYEMRWPNYMAAVRDRGLRSILAIPLPVEGSAVAAINFYAREEGAFSEDDVETAKRYAAAVSTVVAIAIRIADVSEGAEDRERALESRTAINMAVGIVMAQNQCSLEEAVGILKAASNHRNIKVRDLAEQIITSTAR